MAGCGGPVELTWNSCHYGNTRPWFLCPGKVNGVTCGRRVAILYDAGKYFLCRHCYRLVYGSQRRDRAHRLMEKARGIRMRFGGTANLLERFPWKPNGMHWRTYWRLRTVSEMDPIVSTGQGLC